MFFFFYCKCWWDLRQITAVGIGTWQAMEVQHFWIQLWDEKVKKKKTWTFFVDSSILVKGYHIYSTAYYYNSSVSNLYFAWWDDSQVFFTYANFPHFSGPTPFLIFKSMWANIYGVSFLNPRQVVTFIVLSSATTTKSWLWEESQALHLRDMGRDLCVVSVLPSGLTDRIRSFGW